MSSMAFQSGLWELLMVTLEHIIPPLPKSGLITGICGVTRFVGLLSSEPGLQNAQKVSAKNTWSMCCCRNKHSGQVSFTSALKAMQKEMFLVTAGFIH